MAPVAQSTRGVTDGRKIASAAEARPRLKLPPGCVTGVGSLPFIDPTRAVEFVRSNSGQIPYWPQLPLRTPAEGIVAQALGPLVRLLEPASQPYCWQVRSGCESEFLSSLEQDEACLVPSTAAGFFSFERAFESGEFRDAVAIKGQTEGPITLSHCIFLQGKPLILHPDSLRRVSAYISRHVTWQIDRLKRFGKPVILVIDEPSITFALSSALCTADALTTIQSVILAIRASGAHPGLHCCAPLPADVAAQLDLDWFHSMRTFPSTRWVGNGWRLQR